MVKPAPLAPTAALQQTLGNRALGKLVQRRTALRLQTRLKVGQPGDVYEQEADHVAERVMRMPAPPQVQRQCTACGDDEKKLRRVAADGAAAVSAAPASVTETLQSGSAPLPAATRAFFEPRFGYDFGGVRVHADARAADSAAAVNALAYTVGAHIVLGAGQYKPHTAAGQQLLAHELAHVVQQRGEAVQRWPAPPSALNLAFLPEPRLQRACGPTGIGAPACPFMPTDAGTELFRFGVNCDDIDPRETTSVRGHNHLDDFAAGLPRGAKLKLHGYASMDGPALFNMNLSCARVNRFDGLLRSALARAGRADVSITGAHKHGAQPGPAADRRSVRVEINSLRAPLSVLVTRRFRATAASFLSCAPCNPFTDDGTLGVSPPTTEPPSGSSFRQKHFIEAELGTFDGRTIAPGSARLAGSGREVGISHFCGRGGRGHIVSVTPPGAPRLLPPTAHGEGIEFESELHSRVGATVPATLPGAPCGFLGTNPVIPVIGNRFRVRLFADGTKESEFASATLYPSQFLYEDGALKFFGGAPVHPRIDFFAWAATSPAPGGLPAAILGFKALRFACCSPAVSASLCGTVCAGGFSVPGLAFDAALLAAHIALLAASPCPTPCAPSGASCGSGPIVSPSNP